MPRLILLLSITLPLGAACPDTPTFTLAHDPADGTDPFVGFVGDVNGDGKIDVIAGVGFQVRVDYGDGTGIFTPGPALMTCGAAALRSGDFNGDGRSDIAALTACGHLHVFLQTGAGTFALPTDTPVSFPSNMEIGDVDGDGRLDVVATGSDYRVTTLFGDGNGMFASSTIDPSAGSFQFTDSVAIHDFNGDGLLDLAVGVVDRGVRIFTNNGNRTFAPGQLLSPKGGSVRIADFNYDGTADVFASGIPHTAIHGSSPARY